MTKWTFSNGLLASLVVSGLLFADEPVSASKSNNPIDFARDIRPLFEKRCYKCHGVEKQKGGLRLDDKTAAFLGGDSGKVIQPERSAESLLFRFVAGFDPDTVMPPKGDRLKPAEVKKIKEWIDSGAPWPNSTSDSTEIQQQDEQKHWSFVPPQHPKTPAVKERMWDDNPIDRFVLARLESENVSPSPEADRPTLIRRLSFDLRGLPPTVEEVDTYMNDQHPGAYGRLVNMLLASPHFGERWGRHWLDLARYADSDGYEKDSARPYAYLFRDWVIDAINRDLPFDQFSIQQLAGDLLPNATEPQRIATGFHRNTLTNREGGVDQEEFRCKATVDRVNTTGTVWLGLTVGCAECHSHKYDPITQREFYRLYAFFNNASEKDIPAPHPAELAEFQAENQKWERQQSGLQQELSAYLGNELTLTQLRWEQQLKLPEQEWSVLHTCEASSAHGATLTAKPDGSIHVSETNPDIDSYTIESEITSDRITSVRLSVSTSARPLHADLMPDSIVRILRTPSDARSHEQKNQLATYYREDVDPKARQFDKRLTQHARQKPRFPETQAQTLVENGEPRETHVHIRGDFLRKGDKVEPGTPAILHPFRSENEKPNRLDLARWLFATDNPLTPRVAVNRIWHHLFGRGFTTTMSDFGNRGEKPSHPELLDWLATEYVRLGWSRKALIRLIVSSSTYKQASRFRPELAERDPNNTLLARQNRFRLEAETIRDANLTVSGLLNPAIGGPCIRPPLPADIAALGYANSVKWKTSEGADQYRRGLYIFFQRTVPYPMLVTFDAPDSNVSCARRERSNTPLQALTLLNNPVFFECAQALGRRMAEPGASSPEDQILLSFRTCLARPPTEAELSRLMTLHNDHLDILRSDSDRTAQIVEDRSFGEKTEYRQSARKTEARSDLELAALMGVCRAILNLDEFVTRQ